LPFEALLRAVVAASQDFGKGREGPIELQQPLTQIGIAVETSRFERPVKSIARHLPEVCMIACHGAKPRVIELFVAPESGKGLPLVGQLWKGGFRGRFPRCRCDVKQSSIGIKDAGFYRHHILPW